MMAMHAAAAGYPATVGEPAGLWLTPYGALPPAIIYDSLGRCLAPLGCPDYEQLRRYLDRYQRNYGQRFAADTPLNEGAALRRQVAPTPEADVQPAYRGSGQVRPEFENAGKLLRSTSSVGR